jgi:uncharacterized protein DUF3616
LASWIAKAAASFREVAGGLGLKKKVKSTPFSQTNAGQPFNASGVVEVGPDRFLFVDNHDPSALFELALDSDGAQVERISRRPLAGVADGELRDPECLARVTHNGETLLVVASSLCVIGGSGSGQHQVCDGLVRVRYQPHGDLHAEAMPGFRNWLLTHVPSIGSAAEHDPDAGGLNIEGVAWEPHSRKLVFGLRGPVDRGIVTVIQVSVDAAVAQWTTAALGTPSVLRAHLPQPKAKQGVRDISYDDQAGNYLVLVGRSTSTANEPFQLCAWDGTADTLELYDVKFHRSMKPEGVVAFSSGGTRRLLVVDDAGGYAVFDYPRKRQ